MEPLFSRAVRSADPRDDPDRLCGAGADESDRLVSLPGVVVWRDGSAADISRLSECVSMVGARGRSPHPLCFAGLLLDFRAANPLSSRRICIAFFSRLGLRLAGLVSE